MKHSCVSLHRSRVGSHRQRLTLSFPVYKPGNRATLAFCVRSSASHLPDNGCSYTIPRTERLRRLLEEPRGILLGPAAYDGISARLTEAAGFDFAFMSGFSVAGGRLGLPDTGLVSYGEMVEQGRQMIEATSTMPLIGDGDTGYGNAMNVLRTVRGYARAGFSGILIEDQVWPKSCGHVRGKRVVSREEAVSRIRAACDARVGGQDIVIVARTDAKQAIGFQEALERAQAFSDAGADVVFIDALETEAEMRTFCVQVTGAYKMANMLEGGGKTPILKPDQLESMGFKLVAYPLSLLGVSINAMQNALKDLKQGQIPEQVPGFLDLQQVLGFPEYFEKESRYAVALEDAVKSKVVDTGIEPDVILDPNESYDYAGASSVQGTYDVTEYDGGKKSSSGDRRSKWLRFRVIDGRSGEVQLDTKFPAGFLDGVAAVIPQIAGIDLQQILDEAGRDSESGKPVFSFQADGDTIEIFVEER